MDLSKQIKLGAILSYLSMVINILAGLLYTPWMINSIGKENYGLYTLAMSVIALFVFDFGLSSAVTRFLSKYLAEGRQDKANNCLGLVYRLYLGIDVFLLLVLTCVFFFIPQIYRELTPKELDSFRVIYAMAAFYSVLSFPLIPVNGILTAHEKFVQLKICDCAHRVIVVLSMSVCLLLGYGLYALVLVNSLAGITMILLKIFFVQRYTQQRISWGYWNKEELKNVAGYSGWITLTSLAQRCIFTLAPSILGALSGSVDIAILGIAITLEGYTYSIASALNGMFLTKVSRIVANDGDIVPLMSKVGRIQILVIALIVGGVICLGKDFINLWIGEQFTASYICAVLIIAPSLMQLPQEIGMQAIIAQNKVKQQAIVFSGMAVLNLIGAAILSPKFGAIGLSISICIAYFARTAGLDYILYKELKINVWRFFYDSFICMTPGVLISLAVGFIITGLNPLGGWLGFICNLAVFVSSYVLIMYFMALNQFEKNLFLSIFNKLLKKS